MLTGFIYVGSQGCLEGEHDYRHAMVVQVTSQPPSLGTLRAYRSRLEREYLANAKKKQVNEPTLVAKSPLYRSGNIVSISGSESPSRLPPLIDSPRDVRLTTTKSQTTQSVKSSDQKACTLHSSAGAEPVVDASPRRSGRATRARLSVDADVSIITPRPPSGPPPQRTYRSATSSLACPKNTPPSSVRRGRAAAAAAKQVK